MDLFGGLAISGNLLAVASTDARGRIFLFDLSDERLASSWSWSAEDGGPSDAGGVAFDAAYNIYVADTRCDLVRAFSPFGMPVRSFGQPHEREQGAVARDQRGRLDRPHAVAVLDDTLFVACGDRWLVRGVQRFGLDGTPGAPLRSFGEVDGRFGAPRGLRADARTVLVADTQHGVIQRFRPDGSYVARVPTARTPDAQSRPLAVLPHGEALLCADGGDEPGLELVLPAGGFRRVPASAELRDPSGLARDDRGRVFVLDRDGERVVRLTAELAFDKVFVDLREVGFGE